SGMPAADRDNIEQIAMIAALGIGPFAGLAAPFGGRDQTNIEAATRRVADVADQPVSAFLTAIGEIMPTYAFAILGEARSDLTGRALHDRTPQAALRMDSRSIGKRSNNRSSTSAPTAPVGT